MDKTERIKDDAEAYANDRFGEYAGNINDFEYPAWKDCADIYIAGATAENEHMRPVIEAAEKVAKIFAHKGDHQTCAICQLAKALEQWKGTGKEVERPKTIASNCGYCGKLGVNQYLGNQLYLCDECFEDYEKGRDQPEII